MDYTAWISSYVASVDGDTYGKCGHAVQAMKLEFPELRLVRGFVYDLQWGERTHWWCETPDGKVIDPTVNQFPAMLMDSYREHSGPEPTGMCPECGEYTYDGKDFCDDKCSASFMAHVAGEAF